MVEAKEATMGESIIDSLAKGGDPEAQYSSRCDGQANDPATLVAVLPCAARSGKRSGGDDRGFGWWAGRCRRVPGGATDTRRAN